ncbi:hypothetical protein E2C01_028212 [Portunus trituberculatus]|uniref:RNase H type-1 domain-containing protein n=1 Tax=Portunus trituberculatus TaxID=210409 RepID=A0A5B7EJW4_PORTR|nr:hypothetical protein [Portunus trituberculatus]
MMSIEMKQEIIDKHECGVRLSLILNISAYVSSTVSHSLTPTAPISLTPPPVLDAADFLHDAPPSLSGPTPNLPLPQGVMLSTPSSFGTARSHFMAPCHTKPTHSFVDRALFFFAILRVTPPPFLILKKTSPLGPLYPLSSSVSSSLLTSMQWSKAGCPVQGRTLFTLLLHSRYHTYFHIFTDGSCLINPPSVGAAIYIPSRSLATAWRLPATASITTAELFAIKEGLQFATILAAPCSIALFSDFLS